MNSIFRRINIFSVLLLISASILILKGLFIVDNIQNLASHNIGGTANSFITNSAYASSSDNKDTTKKDPTTKTPINIQTKYSDGISLGKYSSSQVELLKELSKRRKELDVAEVNIKNKETILRSFESNIEKKIKELKSIKKEIESSLKDQREIENARVKNLAKIYESMPPKKAAQIWNELDITTLSEIITGMRDSRTAAIMSDMDPRKAKDLSVELSKRTPIPTNM